MSPVEPLGSAAQLVGENQNFGVRNRNARMGWLLTLAGATPDRLLGKPKR